MTRRAARRSALPPIALIGTYVPRACGIATFTRDLRDALVEAGPPREDASPYVVALDHGALDPRRYPPEVAFRLPRGEPEALERVRAGLDDEGVRVVSLQHEFGIYGGRTGREVLGLASALTAPVVTTFHTVLAHPRPSQREVMSRLAGSSARVVVMTERGRALLTGVYGVPRAKVAVIPHGVPDLPFGNPDLAKAAVDLAGRRVVLSFGLLSPNKGLELAIDALAAVVDAVPEVMLVIAGRTHPEVRHRHGEVYRRGLVARIAGLGLTDHVRFVNRFLEPDELAAWLAATDVFVTPYGDVAQITSGTLAYAVAAGAAVVSTPYEHAVELLADGRGVLVPFRDAAALGAAFTRLLTDDAARDAMRRRAWLHGRGMVWPAVGAEYRALFREVLAERKEAVAAASAVAAVLPPGPATPSHAAPSPRTPAAPRAGALAPLAPVARRHLDRLWTPSTMSARDSDS